MDLSGEVKMDMTYVGPKDFENYGYNVYTLKGEAPYQNLYKFIWYSESGRRLFKISNLTLRGYEAKDPDTKNTKILSSSIWMQAFMICPAEQRPSAEGGKAANLNEPVHPLIMREIHLPSPTRSRSSVWT